MLADKRTGEEVAVRIEGGEMPATRRTYWTATTKAPDGAQFVTDDQPHCECGAVYPDDGPCGVYGADDATD